MNYINLHKNNYKCEVLKLFQLIVYKKWHTSRTGKGELHLMRLLFFT